MPHENPDVRRAALRVFQGSKCSGPEVLRLLPRIHQDIGRRLQDVDSRVRGVAALALCRLGCKAAKDFADDLLFILQSGTRTTVDGAELRDVLAALAMLGQSASWAANTVANCLWLEQWSLRRAAAETYGQICGDQRWENEWEVEATVGGKGRKSAISCKKFEVKVILVLEILSFCC